jgi:hypothetical protein
VNALRAFEPEEPAEKLLPQNVEAEAGVLGSVLIDPDAISTVSAFLKAGDFYREAHRAIYQAMLDLAARGTPADLIILTDELARRGKLEDIGGLAYVSSLANQVPTSANVEYYARIVKRCAVNRDVIQAGAQMVAVAYNEPEGATTLDQAERIVARLREMHRAEARPARFQILTAEEAEALEPSPGILGNLLYASSIAFLYARSGRWKTFLALAMGFAIASGGSLFGRRATQGPVVYIAAEGASGIGKRITALRLQHGVRERPPLYVIGRAVNMLDSAEVADLIADIRATLAKHEDGPPRLIIVDTLARSMPGGDENSAKDVNTVYDAAGVLREAFGACVLLIHHDGKEASRGARGSSAIYRNADTVLRISGPDREVLTPGDVVNLECAKPKDAAGFAPIPFTVEQRKWATLAGEFRDSLVIVPAEAQAVKFAPLTPNQRKTLDALIDAYPEYLKATEWMLRTGLQNGSFYDAKKVLDERGLIRANGQRGFRSSGVAMDLYGRNNADSPGPPGYSENTPTGAPELDEGKYSGHSGGSIDPGVPGVPPESRSSLRENESLAADETVKQPDRGLQIIPRVPDAFPIAADALPLAHVGQQCPRRKDGGPHEFERQNRRAYYRMCRHCGAIEPNPSLGGYQQPTPPALGK